jgi:hypothetical protein
MKKWEYIDTDFESGHLTGKTLNDMGLDGWELIFVETINYKFLGIRRTYYFKREIS